MINDVSFLKNNDDLLKSLNGVIDKWFSGEYERDDHHHNVLSTLKKETSDTDMYKSLIDLETGQDELEIQKKRNWVDTKTSDSYHFSNYDGFWDEFSSKNPNKNVNNSHY